MSTAAMNDTGEAAADGVMPTSHADVMPNPKFLEGPPETARETYGPGEAERKRALRERSRDHEEQVASIRVRSLPDDAPDKFRDVKEASKWRAADYQMTRAIRRNQANPDENLWVSGHIVGQKNREEQEAKEAGLDSEVDVIEYTNWEKGERVTDRQAAKDLAEYRRTTKLQEAEAADKRRKLWAEIGAADLVAETQTEQPPEAVTEQLAVEQPEQQAQPDPVETARQQAAAWVQATAQLHNMTQAELLAHAQLSTAAQQHASEFSDVRSYDDLAKLSPDRQARFVGQQDALRTAFGQFQQLGNQRQVVQFQIEHARQAEQAQEFQRYKAEQDALAAKSIPEISGDPETAFAFGRAATEALEEYGITRDAIRTYSPDVVRAMNSASFQRLVADATRYRQGKARAHEVSAQKLPPAQRPGVARDRGDRASADVASLIERGERARPGSQKQLRAFAAAVNAKRQARGR